MQCELLAGMVVEYISDHANTDKSYEIGLGIHEISLSRI